MTDKVKSNLIRCPLLKITRKETLPDGTCLIIEEFNDCYKSYCAAWDSEKQTCTYFTVAEPVTEDDEESSSSK